MLEMSPEWEAWLAEPGHRVDCEDCDEAAVTVRTTPERFRLFHQDGQHILHELGTDRRGPVWAGVE